MTPAVKSGLRLAGLELAIFAAAIALVLAVVVASGPQGTSPQIYLQTGHSSSVYAVAFGPDGQTLASGSDDGAVKLWDAATGEELRPLGRHSSAAQEVAFSPDGRTLASGGDDGAIKLWDAATGQELWSLDSIREGQRGGLQPRRQGAGLG